MDSIAKEYPGITRFSIKRHFDNHVSDKRKCELLAGSDQIATLVSAAAKEDRSLLDYYILNRGIAAKRMLACAEAGDTHGVNLMLARLHENYAGIARLTGQIGQLSLTISQTNNVTNNFVGSPAYLKLVEIVLEQLRDLPERRAAIVAALRDLGDDAETPRPNAPALIEGEVLADVE
jgi:hypothetical protein